MQTIRYSLGLIWDISVYFLNDNLLCTCDMAGLEGKHEHRRALPALDPVLITDTQTQPREDTAFAIHYNCERAGREKDVDSAAENRGFRLPRAPGMIP